MCSVTYHKKKRNRKILGASSIDWDKIERPLTNSLTLMAIAKIISNSFKNLQKQNLDIKFLFKSLEK